MQFARGILAIYVLLWFNVVVPGHTRGMLTMPGGKGSEKSGVESCCSSRSAGPNKDHKPTREQQRRCAVCYVAATYSVPVVLAIDLRPAERVAIANVAALAQVRSIEFPAPYWPIGPPGLA